MSDNSRKSDRLRWVVPIVVAVIAAVGTVIAALAPSLFGSDEEAAPPSADTTTSPGAPGAGRPTTSKQATPTATVSIAYTGQGVLVFAVSTSVDLDSMTDGTGGDKIADLFRTDTALTAGSGSRIALPDRTQAATPEVCRSALDERGTDTIAAAQIETGRSLCIRTTAGRTGAVTLTDVSKRGEPPELSNVYFSYVIWNPAPE